MSSAIITWYGHSCFKVQLAGSSLVLDPYASGSVPGLRMPDLTADAIHISHDHSDHNAFECVLRTGAPLRFRTRRLESVHDHHNGSRRGPSRILIIEGDGLRIVHLGDQGCPLTREQTDQIGRPDLLMIPIGGHFTIDAKEARDIVDQLHPHVTVPMHYRSGNVGYDVLSTLDDFLQGDLPVVYAKESSFVITPDMPEQILVPQLVQ